jgi:hypothetical protein
VINHPNRNKPPRHLNPEFELIIKIDNDAFKPDPVPEVARILRGLADKLEQTPGALVMGTRERVFDVNGNRIGFFDVIHVPAPKPAEPAPTGGE